jgi:Ca2+-binding RTX toxin-like protein/GH24 family phage-related lysozyme (muramidase)
MIYKTMSQEDCFNFAVKLVEAIEGLDPVPVDIGDGMSTVGYGYTFNRNNNVAIFAAAGISLSDDQSTKLAAIDAAPASQRTALGNAFPITISPAQGEALLKAMFVLPEVTSVADALGMPFSAERAVMLSMQYNRGRTATEKKTIPLQFEIGSADRAEAWFQWRYQMWGSLIADKAGLLKRRFWESTIFGLYDPGNITAADSVDALAMLQNERQTIFTTETDYGVGPGGQAGTLRNVIALANNDSKLSSIAKVDTILQAFSPAQHFILNLIAGTNPQLNSQSLISFAPSINILLSSSRDPVVRANLNYGYPAFASQNHILIGQESGDKLIGGTGSDVMFVGAGDEILYAGSGADTLVGGQAVALSVFGAAGYDSLVGGDGFDEFDFVATQGLGGGEIITSGKGQKGDIKFIGVDGSVNTLGGAVSSRLLPIVGKNDAWSSDGTANGIIYVYDPVAYDLSIGINGAVAPNGFQIDIADFDFDSAMSGNGYLGIYLQNGANAAIGTPTASQARTGNASTHASISKDGSQTFSVLLAQAATSALTLVVKLTGGNPDDFGLSTGSQVLQFTNGEAHITLAAGADSSTLALVNTRDPGQSVSAELDFSLLNSDGSDSGIGVNSLNFNLTESAHTAQPSNVVPGVPWQDDPTHVSYFSVKDATDDIVNAGSENNSIETFNGDDSITSGSGNDTIRALNGADTIEGGNGQDIITTTDGNSEIYGGSKQDIGAAIQDFQNATASGIKGSAIGVGNGNNVITGTYGNDLILVGQGNNVIVAGPGQNLIEAGNAAWTINPDWSWSPDGQWNTDGSGFSVWPENYAGSTVNYEGVYSFKQNSETWVPVGIGNDTIYGGKGDSVVELSNGDNYVDAGGGNDLIEGGMGNDTIFAGSGNVTVQGGGGDTYIDGESGNDLLLGEGGNNTIYGGSGNDTIFAGDDAEWATTYKNSKWDRAETGNNYVDGGSGNDLIYGSGGDDTLIAGSGSTTVLGGIGNEYIEGGSGIDDLESDSQAVGSDGAGSTTIAAGSGNTTIIGGAGNDSLYGGDGTDFIQAGSGDQLIYTGDGGTVDAPTQVLLGAGQSTVYGGSGVDQIQGGSGGDTLTAGTGDTTLTGGSGTDVMYAGDGHDALIATSGTDTMYGGTGNATMQGGSGTVVMYGGEGDNELIAGSGDATLNGGSGNSTLQGGSGSVTMQAGDGDQLLMAGAGNATLRGGVGDDTLQGGSSQTLMVAGPGSTTMIGGSGQDTFQVGADAGDVVIANFGPGDILQLASGISIDDLAITDGSSGGRDSSGLDIELDEGGSVVLANGNDAPSARITTADGGSYTVAQLIDSTRSQTSTTLADGSAGTKVVTPDGQGQANIVDYDASGNQVGTGVSRNDGHGNSTLTSYDASNAETSAVYTRADGSAGATYFESGGSSFGSRRDADGTSSSFTDDGRGDTSATHFDATGKETAYLSRSSDGSSISDTFAADGSETKIATDAAGNTTTTLFGANGSETGDSWTRADGTGGSEVFNPDGSVVEASTDAQGTTTTVNIGRSGAETSSTWRQADGTRGTETFNADGSTVTTVTRPDATSTRTVDDGQGGSTIVQIDASGRPVSDSWTKPDSSSGSDTFASDGASNGIAHNADGTVTQYVDDGQGDRSVSEFDASGAEQSDRWQKADGSHGTDTFNADGSVSHLSIGADGKVSYSVTDGQGNVTSTGGTGSGVDSSLAGTLAQEPAFTTTLSQYLVSSLSPPYATPAMQTVPVQTVYDDDTAITAGSSTYALVTSSTRTVTTTTLETTTSVQPLWDKWLSVNQMIAMGALPSGGIGSVQPVMGTGADGQPALIGGWENVGHATTTTTSHPVTSTYTTTTYQSSIAGAIEELDTGDADHTIGLENRNAIVNAGAGNDFIAPTGFAPADASLEQSETLTFSFDNVTEMPRYDIGGSVGSFLDGGAGKDTIIGTAGDDVLVGGAGDDTLSGGAGADTYLVFAGADQGWDTIEDTGFLDEQSQPWIADLLADYGGAPATDTLAFQEGVSLGDLRFSWGRSDTGLAELDVSWGVQTGIRVVIPTADQRAMGEGIEQFAFSDGTTLTMDQVLALAPAWRAGTQSGSDSYDASLGYALSWTNTQFADGSTESAKTYTYADGSIYATDTTMLTDGAVNLSWTRSDDSHGTWSDDGHGDQSQTTYPADGSMSTQWVKPDGTHGASTNDGQGGTVQSTYSADGSYTQTWTRNDGSHGTNFSVASSGEQGGTSIGADGSQQTWDTVPLAGGASESKTSSTDTSGITTSYDTVTQADGSYAQTWTATDGSTGTNGYDATSGVTSGSKDTQGSGVNVSWTRSTDAHGSQSQVATYDYDDGSVTTIDSESLADGASWQQWAKSDGSTGTSYVGASGGGGDAFAWGAANGASSLETTNGLDSLALSPGIADDQLWFHRDGNDLDISLLGSSAQLSVEGWYLDSANQLATITLGNGQTLAGSDVQQLVDAMASFAVPDASQAAYTLQEHAVIAPVIAANWH